MGKEQKNGRESGAGKRATPRDKEGRQCTTTHGERQPLLFYMERERHGNKTNARLSQSDAGSVLLPSPLVSLRQERPRGRAWATVEGWAAWTDREAEGGRDIRLRHVVLRASCYSQQSVRSSAVFRYVVFGESNILINSSASSQKHEEIVNHSISATSRQ